MAKQRRLIDLISVGPATVQDFEDLGITEVEHLIDKDAGELYEEIQRLQRRKIDICLRDVFEAAIAQARDPQLPKEKCQWAYYSRRRKAAGASQ